MLLDKLLFKLRKRRKHQFIAQIINIYTYTHKPTIDTISVLVQYASPSKLYKWIDLHRNSIPEVRYLKLLSCIENSDQEKLIAPKKRLKIAVCISGESRTFQYCIKSFHRFFYGHDIDIYIANKSPENSSLIKQNYNPRNLLQYTDIDYTDHERKGIETFNFLYLKHNVIIPKANTNIYPMWFGIQKSFQALNQTVPDVKNYDAICRCRFDTFFRKPLTIESFPESNIFIDPNYNEHEGYSDQFAIGHPNAMTQYFNLYDWIPKSFDYDFGEKGYLPEILLKKYLEKICELKITGIDFETRLLRNDFIGLESHEIPIKSNSTNLLRNQQIQNYIKIKFPDLYPHQ